jgi:hypothetical protein
MDAHDLFERRIAALPALLAEVIDGTARRPALDAQRLWLTGIGASEGPARLVASVLAEGGRHARFVPLSSLCLAEPAVASATTLVLFSQGLSPNARIALARAARFAHLVLFTALGEEALLATAPESAALLARGQLTVVRHPPSEERGTLARVLGPQAAAAAALAAAGLVTSGVGPSLERAMRTAAERSSEEIARLEPEALSESPVWLAVGEHTERCVGLSNLWHEALLTRAPPLVDALGAAHGLLQERFERPATLVCFRREAVRAESALFTRFASMWEPSRHALLHLRAELCPALAPFEHAAALGAVLLRAASTRALVGEVWPGRGRDGPLYELTTPLDEGPEIV